MVTSNKKSFIAEFLTLIWAAKNVLIFNLIMIAGGTYIFHWEGLKNSDGSIVDSIYAAFVTSLTIGYGDMTPVGMYGKITAVILGIVGMLFIGVIVGASIKALERSR